MRKNCAENFETNSLNKRSDAKPTYETILRKLNAVSCAHVTLREPINKNKTINNNIEMENNSNKNNNNHWRDCAENAICDTPTQELDVSVQQRVYRNQQCLQQPPMINSTIEKLVRTRSMFSYTRISYCFFSHFGLWYLHWMSLLSSSYTNTHRHGRT